MLGYKFEENNYESGFLDKSVDAAYIIHLSGNGRLESVKRQINAKHPSKTTYILHNSGYKSGLKPDYIKTSSLDLVDAFITIFKHSQENNYNNILILEDDFVFSDDIESHINNVDEFIKSKNNERFIYLLGCVPGIVSKYDDNHMKRINSIGCHGIIYSNKFITKTLRRQIRDISDWDFFTNKEKKSYMYKKALVYQPFPVTENSKGWGKNTGGDIGNFYGSIIHFYLNKSIENNDNDLERSYDYFYRTSVKHDCSNLESNILILVSDFIEIIF